MKWPIAFSADAPFITLLLMNLAIVPHASRMIMNNPQLSLNLNPDRPSEIITHDADEFDRVCARADRLQLIDGTWTVVRRGEFAIEWIATVPQHNAWYKVKVRWH